MRELGGWYVLLTVDSTCTFSLSWLFLSVFQLTIKYEFVFIRNVWELRAKSDFRRNPDVMWFNSSSFCVLSAHFAILVYLSRKLELQIGDGGRVFKCPTASCCLNVWQIITICDSARYSVTVWMCDFWWNEKRNEIVYRNLHLCYFFTRRFYNRVSVYRLDSEVSSTSHPAWLINDRRLKVLVWNLPRHFHKSSFPGLWHRLVRFMFVRVQFEAIGEELKKIVFRDVLG